MPLFPIQGQANPFHSLPHVSVEITNNMQPCNRIYYSTVLLQGCILLVISTESYYDARIHEY